MREAVIVDAVRTPIGRAHNKTGHYRDVRADDLSAHVIKALVERLLAELGNARVLSGDQGCLGLLQSCHVILLTRAPLRGTGPRSSCRQRSSLPDT